MKPVIRPNYIVHWTGKDICTDLNDLNDSIRKKYIYRLIGTLKEGLWMIETKDKINDGKNHLRFTSDSVTCFTDLRLTNSFNHVKTYGLMGFGFLINFILQRNGAPVQYFQCGKYDQYASIIYDLIMFLHENSDKPDFSNHFESIKILAGLFKPMFNDDKSINYMEEFEWRIVYNNLIEKKYLSKTNKEIPRFKIKFTPSELALLILPDKQTKSLFFQDSYLNKWHVDSNFKLTIISYEELLQW